LSPDVILMDREENRLQDYEALRELRGPRSSLSDTAGSMMFHPLLEHLGDSAGPAAGARIMPADLRHCLEDFR
jgi:hypothetical protein